MICSGDTIGTFQIESRAQIQTLLRTQPRCLEDLVVQVAIVRPGPIIGGAVNPYVRHRELTRRGLAPPIAYDHPLLEPVLRETLGVVLYQEQVLGVAMALAGFSAGQADQLRRAMTRKRSREAMTRSGPNSGMARSAAASISTPPSRSSTNSSDLPSTDSPRATPPPSPSSPTSRRGSSTTTPPSSSAPC